jgi:hypothetical protein
LEIIGEVLSGILVRVLDNIRRIKSRLGPWLNPSAHGLLYANEMSCKESIHAAIVAILNCNKHANRFSGIDGIVSHFTALYG